MTALGKVTLDNFSQFINSPFDNIVIGPLITAVVKFEQPAKADSLKVLIQGNSIDGKAVQPSNACEPIEDTLESIFKFESNAHPVNAQEPIWVSVDGNKSVFKFEHPLNA